MTVMPNHSLQRTRRERRGCNRGVPWAGSLSLGRSAKTPFGLPVYVAPLPAGSILFLVRS